MPRCAATQGEGVTGRGAEARKKRQEGQSEWGAVPPGRPPGCGREATLRVVGSTVCGDAVSGGEAVALCRVAGSTMCGDAVSGATPWPCSGGRSSRCAAMPSAGRSRGQAPGGGEHDVRRCRQWGEAVAMRRAAEGPCRFRGGAACGRRSTSQAPRPSETFRRASCRSRGLRAPHRRATRRAGVARRRTGAGRSAASRYSRCHPRWRRPLRSSPPRARARRR